MTMRNARIDKTINHPRFDETVEPAPGSFGRAMGLGIDVGEANTFVDEAGPLAYGVPVGGGEPGRSRNRQRWAASTGNRSYSPVVCTTDVREVSRAHMAPASVPRM